MQINGIIFNDDLYTILEELQTQLHINGIDLLNTLRPTGNNIMVNCPYHKGGKERKPSAGFRKTDGLFSCFTCHEVHSLQEVISHCFGYHDDMIGAFGWNWLLKNFATLQVEERKDVKVDIVRTAVTNNFSIKDNKLVGKNKSDSNGDISDIADNPFVSEEELDSYRYIHPYWAKRGITDEEIIELFDLGYDKDNDCITFPVRDINGNCLFVAKRSVKTKFFSYPSGSTKSLYGIYEITQCNRDTKEIIVCESMLDALSFWQVGKVAVALNGTCDYAEYKQLRELPCRELILCTDMDNAGMDARKKIRKNVTNKILSEYFLPKGCKDANDCTREQLSALEKVY